MLGKTELHTLGVGESDSKSVCLWLALADIGSSVPDPTSVGSNIGRQLHLRDDYHILANIPFGIAPDLTYRSG